MIQSGLKTLGPYELLMELSSGGMGSVYLARRYTKGFEKFVAIKTIKSGLQDDGTVRALFMDEARLMGRLSHRAIAQVYDFGSDQDLLYLVMEYVPGVPLGTILTHCPHPWPPHLASAAIAEACRGLHAAHELTDIDGRPLDVVHRDISPSNLLLTFDGHLKIIDFGIALTSGRQAPPTELGGFRGKVAYASPEQVNGVVADHRSDIFSLGVVLYELLVAQPLFQRNAPGLICRAITDGHIPNPSELVPGIHRDLDKIVARALCKDRDQRFQTASEFADSLETITPAPVDGETLAQFAARTLQPFRLAREKSLRDALSPSHLATHEKKRVTARIDASAFMEQATKSAATIETDSFVPPPSFTHPTPLGPLTHKPKPHMGWKHIGAIVALLCVPLTALLTAHRDPPPGSRASESTDAGKTDIDPHSLSKFSQSSPPRTEGPEPPSRSASSFSLAPQPTPKEIRRSSKVQAGPNNQETRRRHTTKRKSRKSRATRRPSKPIATNQSQAPKPNAFGFASIDAHPYALVKLESRMLGPTPILNLKLAVGIHRLDFLDPTTQQLRASRSVTIRENERHLVIVRKKKDSITRP